MTPRGQDHLRGAEAAPAVSGTQRPASPAGPRGLRLGRMPLPVLLGLMLVGGLCALLALNTASAAQELKQRSLTEANAALSDQEQQLMRDLAARQAPAALAAAAAAQGLVPNPNPAFLRLNADGSVTVLGSPTPASVAPPRVIRTPKATVSPGATASKPASSASTSRPAARPSPSASASGQPARSSARPSAPVVTVTVTRPAPAATPSASARPSTSTTRGGR